MTKLQIITLTLGCSAVVCGGIAATTGSLQFGYLGNFLGRLSGYFYMIVLDKPRPEYLLPVGISVVNSFVASETLLFAEMMVASAIYQYSAKKTFDKMNKLAK